MILSALVVAMLGVDGGVTQFVDLRSDAVRAIGVTVTARGMVRTLPSVEFPSLPTGIALDDGTLVYLEGTSDMAKVWALFIGQYVAIEGELTQQTNGAFKIKGSAMPRLVRHGLDHLDRQEVLLEGRASTAKKTGVPTLIVDRHIIPLSKLAAWPEATYWTFVIVKGTMKRTGDEWILEATEWKPAERKDPPPKP